LQVILSVPATETKPQTAQLVKCWCKLFSAGKGFVDPLDKDSTDVPETLSGFVDLIAVEPEHRRNISDQANLKPPKLP
jgi:hypothetical protein